MENTRKELVKEIDIIYRDDHILVVNKPSGLIVNRVGLHREYSLQDWVEENFRLKGSEDSFLKRAGVVHRLDKPTSGLLVVALSEEAFLSLLMQFRERQIKKEYLLLAHGCLDLDKGFIDKPLGRNPYNPIKFGVYSGGKVSRTEFEVLENYRIPKRLLSPPLKKSKDPLLTTVSFVKAKPLTGRTHQIRVHFKYLRHPLVADPLYVGKKILRSDLLWCKRLFLHASSLRIKHPDSGKILSFKSSLPPELETVLKRLYNWRDA